MGSISLGCGFGCGDTFGCFLETRFLAHLFVFELQEQISFFPQSSEVLNDGQFKGFSIMSFISLGCKTTCGCFLEMRFLAHLFVFELQEQFSFVPQFSELLNDAQFKGFSFGCLLAFSKLNAFGETNCGCFLEMRFLAHLFVFELQEQFSFVPQFSELLNDAQLIGFSFGDLGAFGGLVAFVDLGAFGDLFFFGDLAAFGDLASDDVSELSVLFTT
jgi:hypothetical protein